MASQSPAVVQNENLPIHRGKSIAGPKANAAKSLKKGLQERKALRDLSNANKPPAFRAPETYTLKDKSALPMSTVHDSGITKTIPKKSSLTNEQIKRCDAWAKEGIEQAHFTRNDLQELQKDQQDERVRKEVEMVLSALRELENEAYDLGMPVKSEQVSARDKMRALVSGFTGSSGTLITSQNWRILNPGGLQGKVLRVIISKDRSAFK